VLSNTLTPKTAHSPPTGSSTSTSLSSSSHQQPERYTVITRGISFHLSRAQIESYSPNYFTAAFLEHDFAEAESKVLYIDRNPQLFALVVEHLSGYKVTPLTERVMPQTMSLQVAHENLLADAEYFQLDKLGAEFRNSPVTSTTALPADIDPAAGSDPKTLGSTHNLYKYLRWCGLEEPTLDRVYEALTRQDIFSARALRVIAL
jgi:hypothetical protein